MLPNPGLAERLLAPQEGPCSTELDYINQVCAQKVDLENMCQNKYFILYTHTLFRENFQNGKDFHYKNYFDSSSGDIEF